MIKKDKNSNKELEGLLKRVQADFENFRKRVEQERLETRKSATADLVLSMLPVLDNFKRAAGHAPQDSFGQGIKAIERQFEDVLNQIGLEQISVNPGDVADPLKHEVVSQEEAPGRSTGTIVRELEAGYFLNSKLLRPTKVSVAK